MWGGVELGDGRVSRVHRRVEGQVESVGEDQEFPGGK